MRKLPRDTHHSQICIDMTGRRKSLQLLSEERGHNTMLGRIRNHWTRDWLDVHRYERRNLQDSAKPTLQCIDRASGTKDKPLCRVHVGHKLDDGVTNPAPVKHEQHWKRELSHDDGSASRCPAYTRSHKQICTTAPAMSTRNSALKDAA